MINPSTLAHLVEGFFI